jgi:hypothetical protein
MNDLPDGFKWLLEAPEPWKYPTDLRGRPNGPTINLMIDIITSNLIGNDIIETAGKMISAYAALNNWIGSGGARGTGFEGLATLEAEMSYVARDIHRAWVAFRDAFAPTRRVGVAEAEEAALRQALLDGVSRLNGLRQVPLPPESQG